MGITAKNLVFQSLEFIIKKQSFINEVDILANYYVLQDNYQFIYQFLYCHAIV